MNLDRLTGNNSFYQKEKKINIVIEEYLTETVKWNKNKI